MTDTLSFLTAALHEAGARRVVDLGCGDGTIAATLVREGLAVTGVDPSADMLARARQTAPAARFVQSTAEDLDDAGGFDAAFFVNALHHVAPERMRDALRKAAALVGAGGTVIVVEPLAEGSFFGAMRPVEDETAIRAAAARAVDAAVAEGLLVLRHVERWERESRFDGIDDFVGCLTRVSPERARLAEQNAGALASAWDAHATTLDGKAVLVQPHIGWVLAAPNTKAPA